MKVLDTPFLDLFIDLYQNPRSDERWTPPQWQPSDKQGRVLGQLSPASWRLVGVMRDANVVFNDRVQEAEGDQALHAELMEMGRSLSYAIARIADAQIRADLVEAGVSSDDASHFCIREDGAVMACTCSRLMAELDDLVGGEEPYSPFLGRVMVV